MAESHAQQHCAVEGAGADVSIVDEEVIDVASGPAGMPAVEPSPHPSPVGVVEGSETIDPPSTARPVPEEGGNPQDELVEKPIIFGRWASVVPVDGTPFCHFFNPSGPLQALVLPPASQVCQRYQQALAFMRYQAGRGAVRPWPGLDTAGSTEHSPDRDAVAAQGHRCPLMPLLVRLQCTEAQSPASPGATAPPPHVPDGGLGL